MKRAVHQFTAGFAVGDAITHEARLLRTLFRSWDLESDIFSEPSHINPELRREVKDVDAFATVCRPEDVVLLHLSIGSRVNDVFRSLPCRKVIRYHNITPPDYFRGFSEQVVRHLEWGRRQARELAGGDTRILAVSRYNADDLMSLGHRDVRVLPLLFDMDFVRTRPDAATARKYRDGRRNILFVGRCAPNKRIDDLLRAFFFFQSFVEPASRLILAGAYAGMDRYYALLRTMVVELRLERVVFAGSVPQAALNGLYAAADLFLCMSEHEGFGIPLFESMVHDVPVLAYAAAAVPETLDGAGVLAHRKSFEHIAEMMGVLVGDSGVREKILRAQRERVERYIRRDLPGELRSFLEPLLKS